MGTLERAGFCGCDLISGGFLAAGVNVDHLKQGAPLGVVGCAADRASADRVGGVAGRSGAAWAKPTLYIPLLYQSVGFDPSFDTSLNPCTPFVRST